MKMGFRLSDMSSAGGWNSQWSSLPVLAERHITEALPASLRYYHRHRNLQLVIRASASDDSVSATYSSVVLPLSHQFPGDATDGNTARRRKVVTGSSKDCTTGDPSCHF